MFAWLRPNDLIWNYLVNNYLLGTSPPAFDILYWNQDAMRMTAGLHRDFVRDGAGQLLDSPGGLTVLGTEVDLARVDLDSYVVAGVADHICPWQTAYRSTQLLGGKTRFVLSTAGTSRPWSTRRARQEVQVPGQRRRHRRRAGVAASAATEQGTWWPDYAAWLAARSGGQVAAPAGLGGDGYRVIEPAPGSYVRTA